MSAPDAPQDLSTPAPPRHTDDLSVSPRDELLADAKAGATRTGSSMPHPGVSHWSALFLFLCVVPLFVLVSTQLKQPLELSGLVVLQLSCVLTPALIYIRLLGLSFRETLALRKPHPRAMIGSILLGGGAWFVLVSTVLWVQNQFLPPSEAFLQQREALFTSPSGVSGWFLLWLAAALTPAICEEILFRGALLYSFRRRLGTNQAIGSVSVLFALFHFNIYQLSITFLLACLLGWLLVRTGSMLCTMTFHLTNNSLVLILAQGEEETLPVWMSALFVTLAVLGFLLIWTSPGLPRHAVDNPDCPAQ